MSINLNEKHRPLCQVWLRLTLCLILVLGLVCFGQDKTRVEAQSPELQAGSFIDLTQEDPVWGKPVFAYGAALDHADLVRTAQLFGISNWDQVRLIPVSAQDMIHYIAPKADPNLQLYSAVLIQGRHSGRGVQVRIISPDLITSITAAQYAGAAITAGVTDARIMVGSVNLATGESALTGVYKAYDQLGEKLDPARMELAQEELELVSGVAQENRDLAGFSIDAYDQAMTEIKRALAGDKSSLEKLLQPGKMPAEPAGSDQGIAQLVRAGLAEYGLDQLLSGEQIDRLSEFFGKWQTSDAANSEQTKSQLSGLAENLLAYGGELIHDLQDQVDLDLVKDLSKEGFKQALDLAKEGYRQAEKAGLIDRIGDFLSQVAKAIFQGLVQFFE